MKLTEQEIHQAMNSPDSLKKRVIIAAVAQVIMIKKVMQESYKEFENLLAGFRQKTPEVKLKLDNSPWPPAFELKVDESEYINLRKDLSDEDQDYTEFLDNWNKLAPEYTAAVEKVQAVEDNFTEEYSKFNPECKPEEARNKLKDYHNEYVNKGYDKDTKPELRHHVIAKDLYKVDTLEQLNAQQHGLVFTLDVQVIHFMNGMNELRRIEGKLLNMISSQYQLFPHEMSRISQHEVAWHPENITVYEKNVEAKQEEQHAWLLPTWPPTP